MDNYYIILGLNKDCSKQQIKKKYRELSLRYHPDKNKNISSKQFIKINEAYHHLYDDDKRKLHDIHLFLNDINLTESDYEILLSYYKRFIESNEYKLMKMLYDSIPSTTKENIWNKFKYRNTKIIKSHKSIDITGLINNDHINLVLSNYDYENNILKIIYIFSKSGNYYLYLRKPPNKLNLYNGNYIFTINFYILN